MLALAVVFLWATTPAVGKITLQNMNSFELLFYSFPFSVLALLIAIALDKGLGALKGYTLKDYGTFAFMGFLGCYMYYFLFFAALDIGSAQEVFILNYLWPVALVLFASFLLNEKLTKTKLAGVSLGFGGAMVIILGGNGGMLTFNPLADVIAVLAAFTTGLFFALGKKLKYDKLVATFHYYLFACLLALLTFSPFIHIRKLSMLELFGVGWIGAFTDGIATFLWFKAIELGEVARPASIVFLTPFVSLIFIYFIIHEPIIPAPIIGLLLIILGAWLVDQENLRL